MAHSEFDDPDLPVDPPLSGLRLSGRLRDFQDNTRVRLRLTVTQRSTDAIAVVDKIVTTPTFEVFAEELSAGRVKGSPDFDDDSPVIAKAQASIQWGKELKLRKDTV